MSLSRAEIDRILKEAEERSKAKIEKVGPMAVNIMDSEAMMWIMVGANHLEAHLDALRPAYAEYVKQGGGYKNS